MDYRRERYVTWDEIQEKCRALANRIIEKEYPYQKILAVARGGLFPAGILARELDIRLVDSVCIGTYEGNVRGESVILKPPAADFREGVIVVDDLVDTGSTLALLKTQLVKPMIITVFAKPLGEPLVDLYQEKVDQDVWIRFPWDTQKQQYVKPLVHSLREQKNAP